MGDTLATDQMFAMHDYVPQSPFRPGEFRPEQNLNMQWLGEGAHNVKGAILDTPSLKNAVGVNNYVEAQVWGGVNVTDIAEVVFSGTGPNPTLRASLKEAGVTWRVAK